MELEIEHVEVESAVDGAEIRHSFVEVMREFVAMALKNAVNCAIGQRLDELSGLVVNAAFFLRSIISPFSIGVANSAIVPHVSSYQHCIGSVLPKFLCLSNHHILVLKELVLRELLFLEGIGCVRSEDSCKSNHSDPDPTLELIQLRQLLLRQELTFSSLRTQIGCESGRFLRSQEGQQYFRPEVEFVVADC